MAKQSDQFAPGRRLLRAYMMKHNVDEREIARRLRIEAEKEPMRDAPASIPIARVRSWLAGGHANKAYATLLSRATSGAVPADAWGWQEDEGEPDPEELDQ